MPLGWLLHSVRAYAPYLLELILLAVALRLLALFEPFLFQVIVDRIVPFERQSSLVAVAAVFVAVAVFHVVFEVLAGIVRIRAAQGIVGSLSRRVIDHLYDLPPAFFRRWTVGGLMTRLQEVDKIRVFVLNAAVGMALDLVFVLVYVAVLIAIGGPLAWIVIAALPVQALAYLGLGPLLQRTMRAQFDAVSKHRALLAEGLTGMGTIKALRVETRMTDALRRTMETSLTGFARVSLLTLLNANAILVVDRTVKILIIYAGAQMVFAGEITLGTLLAFYLIAERTAAPIANFATFWEAWQGLGVARTRLWDIVGAPREEGHVRPALPADRPPAVAAEGIGFGYDGGRPILRNVTWRAGPCGVHIVVGPSGVGKSTFARILAGLEAPDTGRVTLGGADLARFDQRSVRTAIAYLPQEAFLFDGTLRDNLVLTGRGKGAAFDLALERADADGIVDELDHALDTPVGERGSALSGGQRQRIALARLLMTQPKVMVLDEPTSALDPQSEKRVVNGLHAAAATATVIVVTHRADLFGPGVPKLRLDRGS